MTEIAITAGILDRLRRYMMSEERGAQSTARPRKRRLWLKILLAVVAAIVVVIIVLPFVLPTGFVAARISSAASSSLNAPFSLGGVSLHGLWFGSVSVNDVKIGQPPDFGGGDFLVAKDIAVRVSLLDLLSKKVTVKSLTIDDPQVNLVRNSQGVWNYEKLAKPSEQPAQPAQPAQPSNMGAVSVGKVRLNNGLVSLNDQKQNLKLTAENVTASVDADWAGENITGSAKASFDLEQPSGKGRFELAAADINVPKQQTAESMQKAALTGTITLDGINVGEAIAAVAPAYKDYVAGKLTLKVNYEVKNGSATVTSSDSKIVGLVLGKAIIASGPVSVGDVAFSVDATASQNQGTNTVDMRKFGLKTSFADLTASGKASVAGTNQTVNAKVLGTITPGGIPAGLVALPPDFKSAGAMKLDASVDGSAQAAKFALLLDAQDLGITYGTTLRKQQGKAALINLAGSTQGKKLTVDNLDVTLTGGKVKASAAVDQDTKAASWNLALNLENLNFADYYPAGKGLAANGSLTSTGNYVPATQGKEGVLDASAKFDNLTLSATETKGATIAVSGSVAANTQRVQAQDLTLNVGGQPVTIQALINTPLTGPQGNVNIKGQEINVDNAMAVLTAFSPAPPQGAAGAKATQPVQPAPQPQAAQTPQETPEQKKAREDMYRKSNVTLSVQIDKLVYQGMPGTNLVVQASLVGGQATLSKATANIFGGTVDLTANYNLVSDNQPFNASVNGANIKASDAAGQYLSKYMPGLGFNGTAALNMKAQGQAGLPHDAMLNSITGDGLLDITNGELTIAGVPQTLLALAKVNLSNLQFGELKVPMKIENGAFLYSYAIPTGRESVFVEGKKFLAGGYSQDVGFSPAGSTARIHLVTIENGKVKPVKPETLLADLAKAGLSGGAGGLLPGVFGQQPQQPQQPQAGQPGQPQQVQPQQPQTPEEQIIKGIGGLLQKNKKKK